MAVANLTLALQRLVCLTALRCRVQVIADGVVIESFGLVVDEASLTGEGEPIHKNVEEDPWVRSGTQVRGTPFRLWLDGVSAWWGCVRKVLCGGWWVGQLHLAGMWWCWCCGEQRVLITSVWRGQGCGRLCGAAAVNVP